MSYTNKTMPYNRDDRLIGNRIRSARLEKRLTQEELADRLNVKQSQISHIEKGRSSITLDHVFTLREVLDQPLWYLLGLPNDCDLTEDEAELLHLYRLLAEGTEKEFALLSLRSWAGK